MAGVLQSLDQMADARSELGAHAEALALYERALDIARKTESPHLVATVQGRLSRTYLRMGQPARAVELLEGVVARGVDAGDGPGVVRPARRAPTWAWAAWPTAWPPRTRRSSWREAAASWTACSPPCTCAPRPSHGWAARGSARGRARGDRGPGAAARRAGAGRLHEARLRRPAPGGVRADHRAPQRRGPAPRRPGDGRAGAGARVPGPAGDARRGRGRRPPFPPASADEVVATARRLGSTVLSYFVGDDALFIWVVSGDGTVRARAWR